MGTYIEAWVHREQEVVDEDVDVDASDLPYTASTSTTATSGGNKLYGFLRFAYRVKTLVGIPVDELKNSRLNPLKRKSIRRLIRTMREQKRTWTRRVIRFLATRPSQF